MKQEEIAFIPKSATTIEKRRRIDLALAARRTKEPFLSLAEWIRQAVDAQADRDLGRKRE